MKCLCIVIIYYKTKFWSVLLQETFRKKRPSVYKVIMPPITTLTYAKSHNISKGDFRLRRPLAELEAFTVR
jgi:hypothetical protein